MDVDIFLLPAAYDGNKTAFQTRLELSKEMGLIYSNMWRGCNTTKNEVPQYLRLSDFNRKMYFGGLQEGIL